MQVNATPIGSFPVSGAIGPYLRVKLVDGALALAGALDVEIGTTRTRVLAEGLGSGDEAAVVFPNATGTVKMIAAGAIAQYGRVYGAAAGKVSATANGNFLGYAITATTADGDELEVLRVPARSGLVGASVAASAAVSNTTDETAFDKTVAIPADSLKAGDVLRVRGLVNVTATNSTDTLTLKLKIGSTVVIATGAVDVANNDVGILDAVLTIRTAGEAGTVVASGLTALGVAGSATARPAALAETAIDTTAAQTVSVSATWSVANVGNSCRLDQLLVERLAA